MSQIVSIKPVIPEQPGYRGTYRERIVRKEGRKEHKLMHYLPPSHPRAYFFFLFICRYHTCDLLMTRC